MPQHDYIIDNQTAPDFRSDLNNALAAISSTNSGPSAPTTTYANMLWVDTTNNLLRIRNEADDGWITLGTLDQVSDTFSAAGLTLPQATWDAGTSTTEAVISPAKLKAAVGGQNLYWEFNTSGTWTRPEGLGDNTAVTVEAWGGGGGGNGSTAAFSRGAGGGGGGYSTRVFRLADLAANVTVTIGAGGAGVVGNSDGSNGGNTSFGTHLTAFGGGGAERELPGASLMRSGGPGGEISAGVLSAPGLGGGDFHRGGFGGRGPTNSSTGVDGGFSVFGGGGGAGTSDSGIFGQGGVSKFGGSGGAVGVAGSVPGGGGGATASGAHGRVRVWI